MIRRMHRCRCGKLIEDKAHWSVEDGAWHLNTRPVWLVGFALWRRR